MYWFTADEHYSHNNIIKYCNRPFANITEMDETIIERHNSVVGKTDIVIHAGDFTLIHNTERVYKHYVKRLKGQHIFLKGSHDKWLKKSAPTRFEKEIEGQFIVVDHYSMRVWHRSHWNSWQLYGHSHGKLPVIGKQHDIGVDNNDFYPLSFEAIKCIMELRSDNFNLIQQ